MSKYACCNKNGRFENFSSNQVKFKDLTVLANFYSNSSMCNQLGRIDNFDKFFPFLLVLEYLQALKSSDWNLLLCIFKKLREEQAARLVFEKAQREEMERRWQSLKAYIDEEAQLSRQAQQVTASSFKVLNLGTVLSWLTPNQNFSLCFIETY